jgi:hypothetical protein
MQHRHVGFILRRERQGVWNFEYAVNAEIKSGQLLLASRAAALRKVRQLISRDLRRKHVETRGGLVRDSALQT